jgi:hypothetical protein
MTRWTDENLYQGRTEEQARKNDETVFLWAHVAFWTICAVGTAWLVFAAYAALTAQ